MKEVLRKILHSLKYFLITLISINAMKKFGKSQLKKVLILLFLQEVIKSIQ
ncbi:VanZ family protein [Bacillus subtilis]|uniref:VanZ family protein n=1 Tax=Bacillus subtilis TaxID=1423 RepID=UPI00330685E3